MRVYISLVGAVIGGVYCCPVNITRHRATMQSTASSWESTPRPTCYLKVDEAIESMARMLAQGLKLSDENIAIATDNTHKPKPVQLIQLYYE